MTAPAADRWLTTPQLADHLGVSVRWIKTQLARRAIPHHRLGRNVRFTPTDVARIEAATAQQPLTRPTTGRLRAVP